MARLFRSIAAQRRKSNPLVHERHIWRHRLSSIAQDIREGNTASSDHSAHICNKGNSPILPVNILGEAPWFGCEAHGRGIQKESFVNTRHLQEIGGVTRWKECVGWIAAQKVLVFHPKDECLNLELLVRHQLQRIDRTLSQGFKTAEECGILDRFTSLVVI